MDSPDGRLTRRRATVTIWAPEASWACFMTSIDAYLPVPTIRRDENSLPPMTRFVSLMALSPTHRSDDLDFVPFPELHRRILAFGRHLAVDRDGREPAVDTEDVEETIHRDSRLHHHRITVDHDLHKQNGRAPSRVRPLDSRRRVPFAGITQCRFEGSRTAPGSQESSPHDAKAEYTTAPAGPVLRRA